MTELVYREGAVDEREIGKLATLFRVVWPEALSLDEPYLRWLYRENPRGPAISVNAWSGEEIVGHYAVIPIGAVRAGKRVVAALSLNTAVHPSQRGKGLFTVLANETYAAAKRKGVDHVVGVANENSAPGFTGKLSFQLVAQLRARLVTYLPAPEDPAMLHDVAWRHEWSTADYRWRLGNPHACYTCNGTGGRMTWRAHTDVPGIHALMETKVSADLAGALSTHGQHGWFSPLRLWIGLEPVALGAREPAGIDLPKFLRRSPLNLIFRDLHDPKAGLAADRVRFTLADFDAF
jgi:predicted N-acetyltransferase YhbS